MHSALFIVGVALFMCLHCLPSFVANHRDHRRLGLIILAALLASTVAHAQSIAIPRSQQDTKTYVRGAVVFNKLANGEKWFIFKPTGFGYQLTPTTESGEYARFSTTVVENNNVAKDSTEMVIIGDCKARTFTVVSEQQYSGLYRSGAKVGPKKMDGVSVEDIVTPESVIGNVFAAVCQPHTWWQ